MKRHILLLFSLILLLTACGEKRSNDPDEIYRLWAHEEPRNGVKPVHGQYWQSAHFTREYIVYLQLVSSGSWAAKYIRQNNLHLGQSPQQFPADAPAWFKPGNEFKYYTRPGDDTSVYCLNPHTGDWFIFEQQL